VRPVNELRAIYRVSPGLAASEARAAAILRLGATGLYCILRGADGEEVLRREEALTARLDREVAEGRLGGYLATSTLLPSRARQERTYRLVGSALLPRAEAQLQALGFDAGTLAELREDYRRQEGSYLESSMLPELAGSPLARSLWIGEVGGESWSAVLLLRVREAGSLAAAVAELPGAILVNKTAELGRTLQRLSAIALWLIAAAYALIFLGLWWLYDLPTAGKLLAVPVAASLLTVAILGWAGLPLNLFAIVGLILIPGIGSDYAVFYEEGRERRAVTMLAVSLSLLSTITSFGALAFSSLAGVFGLTVTLGVTLSFLLSPLAARNLGARPAGPCALPGRPVD
jgi:predicted exporter